MSQFPESPEEIPEDKPWDLPPFEEPAEPTTPNIPEPEPLETPEPEPDDDQSSRL